MTHPSVSEQVFYKKGYEYQLSRDLVTMTNLRGYDVATDYIRLLPNGIMVQVKSYAWNGASCFPDFDWIIRGSCAHDGGYQLIRLGLLPPSCKIDFDELLGYHCDADGAFSWVAGSVAAAVKKFGGSSITAAAEPKEFCSPKK